MKIKYDIYYVYGATLSLTAHIHMGNENIEIGKDGIKHTRGPTTGHYNDKETEHKGDIIKEIFIITKKVRND